VWDLVHPHGIDGFFLQNAVPYLWPKSIVKDRGEDLGVLGWAGEGSSAAGVKDVELLVIGAFKSDLVKMLSKG
jgi:hypothetical protein